MFIKAICKADLRIALLFVKICLHNVMRAVASDNKTLYHIVIGVDAECNY